MHRMTTSSPRCTNSFNVSSALPVASKLPSTTLFGKPNLDNGVAWSPVTESAYAACNLLSFCPDCWAAGLASPASSPGILRSATLAICLIAEETFQGLVSLSPAAFANCVFCLSSTIVVRGRDNGKKVLRIKPPYWVTSVFEEFEAYSLVVCYSRGHTQPSPMTIDNTHQL